MTGALAEQSSCNHYLSLLKTIVLSFPFEELECSLIKERCLFSEIEPEQASRIFDLVSGASEYMTHALHAEFVFSEVELRTKNQQKKQTVVILSKKMFDYLFELNSADRPEWKSTNCCFLRGVDENLFQTELVARMSWSH